MAAEASVRTVSFGAARYEADEGGEPVMGMVRFNEKTNDPVDIPIGDADIAS